MLRSRTRRSWFVIWWALVLGLSVSLAAPAQGATTFRDVPPGMQFRAEIQWLAQRGISTGYPDGTYRPMQPVNRDAMAAFLYRLAGSPAYTAPSRSPFRDIGPGTQFYKEMSWLAATGISTGWDVGGGQKEYRPLTQVNRDAMAAFMYRFAGKPQFTAPTKSPFRDIRPSTQFYAEMAWLAQRGISTGYPDSTYRPLAQVNRDAMAAFMHRLFTKVGIKNVPKVTQEKLITAESMLSAPVPALCDNRPGRFSNGRLPKQYLTNEYAFANIYGIDYPEHNWRTGSFASWMGTDNKAYAALVVSCNQGGVGWPPEVVFYGAGPRVLGAMSVSEIANPGGPGGLLAGRQGVRALRVSNGGIELDLTNNYQKDEGGCCGTMDATVHLRWNGRAATGTLLQARTELPTAINAATAIGTGRRSEMAKYFTSEGLNRIDTWGQRWNPRPYRCEAPGIDTVVDYPDRTNRICYFTTTTPMYLMGWMALEKTGFGQWKALQFDAIMTG